VASPTAGNGAVYVASTDQHLRAYDLGGTYRYVYMDWSSTDIADLFMRAPDRATKMLEQYLTGLIDPTDPRPMVLMIDEWTKPTSKMMQAASARIVLERIIGDWTLPAGSKVYATSNNASDGVGDNILAHCGNRVMFLPVAKPTHRQVAIWGMNNNIHPLLCAWAARTPDAFKSYKTCSEEELRNNSMFFVPGRGMLSFLSPRSWAKCDPVVRNMPVLGENATRAALAGTVGMAAAEAMLAFFELGKDLVDFKTVRNDPINAPVPDNFAAKIMIMLSNLLPEITTQDDLSACVTYVTRFKSDELISLFYCMLTSTDKTKALANRNADIKKWMMTNQNYELLV